MDLENEIKQIVSQIIQIPADELDSDAMFYDDYGMDSLRALEVLAEVENKYKITVDPDKLMEMTSINEVIKITREYLDKKNEE